MEQRGAGRRGQPEPAPCVGLAYRMLQRVLCSSTPDAISSHERKLVNVLTHGQPPAGVVEAELRLSSRSEHGCTGSDGMGDLLEVFRMVDGIDVAGSCFC